MRISAFLAVPVIAFGVSACSNLNQSEERVAGGAALGAGTGALFGESVGSTLLGGAIGAGAGYLYDKAQDAED
jgi:uncharacterized membrane protein